MTQSTATSKQKTKDPKRYEKVLTKSPKCIRCGVCCIIATCDVGEMSNKTGLCSYLTIHKEGYTSCKFIEKYGNLFTGGCHLRRYKEVYELHREEAENRIGIKLVGITAAKTQAKSSDK